MEILNQTVASSISKSKQISECDVAQRRQPVSKIDYQVLREAAVAIETVATPQKLLAFRMKVTPQVVLALLDERERNQQYIKRRDQENEEIALTVGKLRVELEAAKKRIAELEAEPVSQAYNLEELIEGMEVSIDVSTCDADLGNRYFGTVTEVLELDTAKNGYILLVQDAEPNFDINGNSPVIPDGWVIVPKKLTAENGAKGVLSGEFSETTFISCPECFGDDDCDTCDGSGRIEIKVPVTWTTIKSIWDKGIAYFAAEPRQEVNRG